MSHLVGTISHGFEKSCLYGSNCKVLKGSDFWNSYIGILLCIKKGLMKKKIMWTEKTPIVYIKNKTVVYLTLL